MENTLKKKGGYGWQEECLDRWEACGCRGIVQAVTGAGKTMLAVKAVRRLYKKQRMGLRIMVVVPTRALMLQWSRILRSVSLDWDFPGMNCKYQIHVVNSARYRLAREILKELREGKPVFLIADECHRYTGTENRKIFEFAPFLAEATGNYYALGLSATIQSTEILELLEPALGGLIFRYSFDKAVSDGVVTEFILFQIAVDFEEDEYQEYDELSEEMQRTRNQLCKKYPILRESGIPFFAFLQSLAGDTKKDAAGGKLARKYLRLSYMRKRLVCMAKNRIICVVQLVQRLDIRKKIIIFSERVEQADMLYEILKLEYGGKIGRYHSKAGKQANENALNSFRNGELSVLVTCKALDEGIDVPDASIGIIMSGTGMERQRIQRLGRILRKSDDKPIACLYYLFIKESMEEKAYFPLRGEYFRAEDLEYMVSGDFCYPRYDKAAEKLLKKLEKKKTDKKMVKEAVRCLDLGKLRGDWLLEKGYIKEKIGRAETEREKNYWIAMLWLVEGKTF